MRFSPRLRRILPLTLLLLVCLLLLAGVVVRTTRAVLEMNHARRVAASEALGVRPWMTIPYIAKTYKVPEDKLYVAINVTPSEHNRKAPLWALARSEGHDINGDIATLNRTIDALGGQRPPVLPKPPGLPRQGTPRPATPRATTP